MRSAECSAAIDVTARNGPTGRPTVLEDRFLERNGEGRKTRHVVVRAFAISPAVVSAAGPARLVIDLFPRILADISDDNRAGPAALDRVERPAPRIAKTEGPDLRENACAADK